LQQKKINVEYIFMVAKKNLFLLLLLMQHCFHSLVYAQSAQQLRAMFIQPPAETRPGVYWYFMDGNMSRDGITKDLESMKMAGIGSVLFLEVNLGIPRGKVDFLNDEWQKNFAFIIDECKRLGISLTLGIGPGWTGSGGPWVKPEESMKYLVSSTTILDGSSPLPIVLPVPTPITPLFGEGVFTPELKAKWQSYYVDQYVLAFPLPDTSIRLNDINEKAIYYRNAYTSIPGTTPFINEPFMGSSQENKQGIAKNTVIDLTSLLRTDGSLNWKVPKGKWFIMRFGMRNNGSVTRPAPYPGLGFECDKFDTLALQHHLDEFLGKIIKNSPAYNSLQGGLKTLHMDSWEMFAQNWNENFRKEFIRLCGYDPVPFLPVYSGLIVENSEVSERFLWDVRNVANKLILSAHAGYVKKTAYRYGLNLSIEPYDMYQGSDLDLGAVADEPGCEFWNHKNGFASAYSCIEATSAAHIMGRPVIMAEAFTTNWNKDPYIFYPTIMKNQGDWAFCCGINRFYYHTFTHKAWIDDNYRPGMSMGGYGVHWDRGQTWWDMSGDYHAYIARCSYMLRQGKPVADILYLTPEGSPHVFRAPASAVSGHPDSLPDRRGFNFDGCSPDMLMKFASVKDGMIVFESGATYKILVMPSNKTMTLPLLKKIEQLVANGAIVQGQPPVQSPSLSGFPQCDEEIRKLAANLWGTDTSFPDKYVRIFGKGKIYCGNFFSQPEENSLYPPYDATADILKNNGFQEDFVTSGQIRYTHRQTDSTDIWFVSNKTNQSQLANCSFASNQGLVELWDPVTTRTINIPNSTYCNKYLTIPIQFDAYQSFFVIVNKYEKNKLTLIPAVSEKELVTNLNNPWEVCFDTAMGGPRKIIFPTLDDWSKRTEEGIKYYSGKATYKNSFILNQEPYNRTILRLGEVCNMAGIKINGHNLGVIWTAPWEIDITEFVVKGNNTLEIEVVNLWPNRLIGDENKPYDSVVDGTWPDWLINKTPRTSGRYGYVVWTLFEKNAPLLKSGLLGPVQIIKK